eukprot:NODE_549_length_6180_cov_0.430357.p3 type:complete len:180 gc:universal NODE_549_length_6180_cov_0.430357:1946-1407(-)
MLFIIYLLSAIFVDHLEKRHSSKSLKKRRNRHKRLRFEKKQRGNKKSKKSPTSSTSTSTDTSSISSPSTGNFKCNGISSGSASFYDVTSASENDGYANQVACNTAIPSDGLFVAISSDCFSQSICNQQITVNYNGKSIKVPIIDECASCGIDLIDLSMNAWTALESDTNIGVLQNVNWG